VAIAKCHVKYIEKKYLPQILPLSELFVFMITTFKIFSNFVMIVLILHYEPDLWEEYYSHAKYNPVSIQSHKCTFKGQSGLNLGWVSEQMIVV